MKKRIVKGLLAAGIIGATMTGCYPDDVYGNRRTCTEFRMASFGQTWAEAYLDCADLF